jgi:endonuclease I
VWDAHKDLYEDPNNSNNIILFYSQASVSKSTQAGSGGSGNTAFNREHLWPRSYGVDTSGSDNTDLHHLVPTYAGVNSSRGNKYFDYSDPEASGYSSPAYELAPQCTSTDDTFEPSDAQKGHVARAILYMATRYDYLEIVNTPPSGPPSTSDSTMAQLSALLDWNRKALPTTKEKNNNQKIYDLYQNNRNPFIDYPEFADAIWVDGPSWGKWRLDYFALEELNDLSISADSADPDSDGITNLMERAIYSDPKTINEVPPIGIDLINNDFVINFVRARSFENLNTNLILEKSVDLVNWITIDLSSSSTQVINDNQESVQVNIGSTDDYVTISVLNSMALEPFTVSFGAINLYNYENTSSLTYRDLLYDNTDSPTTWSIEMGTLSSPATVTVEFLPTPSQYSNGTFSLSNSIQTDIWDDSVDVLNQTATFKQVAQVSGVTSGATISGSIDTTRSDNYVDVAAMRVTIDYNPGQLRYNIDFGASDFDADDNDAASGFGTNYYTWNTTSTSASFNPFTTADPTFGDYASITTIVTEVGNGAATSFYRLRAENLGL